MERSNTSINIDPTATRIHLSARQIKKVPEELKACVNLQELDLSNNSIRVLPVWLFQLPQLRTLNLSSNKIKVWVLPNHAVTIRRLDLSKNQIDLLPAFGQYFPELDSLDISANRLKKIEPQVFAGATLLRNLSLSKNKIERWPDKVQGLHLLKHLDLSNNMLKQLDWSAQDLKFLEHLDCSNNPLLSFQLDATRFPFLKILSLYRTKLEQLPPSVFELVKLEELDSRGIAFNEKDILIGSGRLKKIRSKQATAPFIAFTKRCSSKNIAPDLRAILFDVLFQQTPMDWSDVALVQALKTVDAKQFSQLKYQRALNTRTAIDRTFEETDAIYFEDSCGLPKYLLEIWKQHLSLKVQVEKERGGCCVFGKQKTNHSLEGGISLDRFWELYGRRYTDESRMNQIRDLIYSNTEAFRKMGLDMILHHALVWNFKTELNQLERAGKLQVPKYIKTYIRS